MKWLRWTGIAILAVGGTAAALWATARPVAESLTRSAVSETADAVARGAAAFYGAAFGGISMHSLESNAIPWRLVAAALVLDERTRDPSVGLDQATLERVMARFGFLVEGRAVNLPEGVVAPARELPFGLTHGDIAPVGGTRVRVANLGCAACHAGVTYAQDGRPRPDAVMLGMPNTSLDLEAYTMAIFNALRRFADDPALLEAADALFPEMGWRERASLRFLVLPLAKQRLEALAGAERPLPFPNGTPGSTNGVAALKQALGAPLIGGGAGDAGVVSIPDLGYRTWRSDLLADGVYAVPGRAAGPTTAPPDEARLRQLAEITTFFTVPSMGVHPDKALGSLDDATAIMAFLGSYRPQPFPGPLNEGRMARGRALYVESCAACHGSYDGDLVAPKLVSYPNWRGDVGTDPLRQASFDAGLVAAIEGSPYRDAIALKAGGGYNAPPLSGLWASAPYLHNGSVPTIAALLSPERRPARFMVGGHALDFDDLGVRLGNEGTYPADYMPFSQPVWIDTGTTGHGASGHRFGEDLSPDEKRDLIEYLKRL